MQIFKSETGELVGLFAAVKRDDKRSIKAVVTKKFKLLSVVVARKSLFIGLHVQNVQIKVGLNSVLKVFPVGPWTCL